MVKKVGQRKFLLKCGYTNEELDKMPPYIAHEIIGDIEKANRAKREKEKQKQEITFGVQECAKCQYKLRCEECCYNEKDIGELIRFEKQLMAKDILNGLECFFWEAAINDTKNFDLYQNLYRDIKDIFKNKYGVTKEN